MSAAAATPAHTAPQQRWVTRSSGPGTPEEARRCRTDRPARYPGLTLVPLSGRTRPPRSGRLRSRPVMPQRGPTQLLSWLIRLVSDDCVE
jgi:hypothetical protein